MKRLSSTDISESSLKSLYLVEGLSMQEIADRLGCSLNKIDYWMRKYEITRRSRSDATYLRNHPDGDPFKVAKIDTLTKAALHGMGLGLYWVKVLKQTGILSASEILTQRYWAYS